MRVRRSPTFSASRGGSGGGTTVPLPPIEPLPPPEDAPPPPPTQIANGLASNASLPRGQGVTSPNGRVQFIHQADGNVVLYIDDVPRWDTGTHGMATSVLWMQPDGNLVLYAIEGYPHSLWASGTYNYPGAYLTLADTGVATIIGRAGDAVWRSTLSAPPRNLPGQVIDAVIAMTQENQEKLRAANLLIELAVGPLPLPAGGNPADWIRGVVTWAQNLAAVRAASPAVDSAMSFIEAAFPHEDKPTSFLSSVAKVGIAIANGVAKAGSLIVRGVKSAAGAVGSVIKFIAGDFPSPKDYEPENLCVTAWIDPPKFALLSAVATIVFPPALMYMALYAPPNIVGLTLGLAEALARGGTKRVIEKILDPLFEFVQELAGTLLDYAFNGNAALIRWALRKIASKLQAGVAQGIILSLAEAADVVIDALKDIQAMKAESFFVNVGEAMKRVAGQFTGELATYLDSIGSAIKAAATAISIIMEKGVDGLMEAVNSLTTTLLGIPGDFASLARSAQIEIAKAKIFGEGAGPTAILGSIVQGIKAGLEGLYETVKELPFQLGDVVGNALEPINQLVAAIDAFIQNLFALAAESQEQLPPEDQLPLPTPDGGAAPAPASGGMSAILFAIAGGLGGALVGGPIGAAAGAGAGLLLGKKG